MSLQQRNAICENHVVIIFLIHIFLLGDRWRMWWDETLWSVGKAGWQAVVRFLQGLLGSKSTEVLHVAFGI